MCIWCTVLALLRFLAELFTEETVQQVETTDSVSEEAAIKIQAAFRGMKAREKVKSMKVAKVTRHAITGVHVEAIGSIASTVAVSPREFSRAERKHALASACPNPNHPVKVQLTSIAFVHINIIQ